MIAIAAATEEAIRRALNRCWLVAVRDRRPPHQGLSAEASAVAGELFRTLAAIDLLRGTRRDVRGLQRRAVVLSARLAELGLAPPPAGTAAGG